MTTGRETATSSHGEEQNLSTKLLLQMHDHGNPETLNFCKNFLQFYKIQADKNFSNTKPVSNEI
jgi:hypothetical protein